MNADDIVGRLQTLLNEKGQIACFLLHPQDIEVLKGSPIFDAEMIHPEYQVRGHIWEIAVREGLYPPGVIGYEGMPQDLSEIEPTPTLPWYEEITKGGDNNLNLALSRIDYLLTWQLFEKCDRELRLIDIDKINDGGLLLTLLTGASSKGNKLPYWAELVQKVEARLLVLKGDPEAVERCMWGLRESRDDQTIIEWTAAMRGQRVILPSQDS